MTFDTSSYRTGIAAGKQVALVENTKGQAAVMRKWLKGADRIDDDAFLAGFIDGLTD